MNDNSAGKLWVTFADGYETSTNKAPQGPGFYPEGDRDTNALSFSMEEAEDQFATVEIVRKQVGLDAFLDGGEKGFLVIWSPSGLPGDAIIVANGRVDEVPSGLLSSRQSYSGVCASYDIEDRVQKFAEEELDVAPFVDRLFSDFDPKDPRSYMHARPGFIHVDPATHRISVIDELRGSRVFDMTNVDLMSGGRVEEVGRNEFGLMARKMRGRVEIEFTQSAEGQKIIATGLTTLDPGVAADPSSAVVLLPSDGWSVGTGVQARVEQDETVEFDCGTRYTCSVDDGRGNVTHSVANGTAKLRRFDIDIARLPLDFTYFQPRREIVEATLDVPVKGRFSKAAADVVEMGMVDVFSELIDTRDWAAGVGYEKGDQVMYGGERYVATHGHLSTNFGQAFGETETIDVAGLPFQRLLPVWKAVGQDPNELTTASPSFFRTLRGHQAVEHMMLRHAKDARRRLRHLRVSLRFAWADAAHLSLKDVVVFRAFDGVNFRNMAGKVCRIRREWPGTGAPTVTIEVGVPFGGDGRLVTGTGPIDEDDAYFEEDYVETGYDEGSVYKTRLVAPADFSAAISDDLKGHVYDFLDDDNFTIISTLRSEGSAARQLRAARLIGTRGGDIRKCTSAEPTKLIVGMRPIVPFDVVEKTWTPRARLLDAPAGF